MKRSYDRVVAQCAVEGRDLAAQLRRWGGREGGEVIRSYLEQAAATPFVNSVSLGM